MEYQIFTDATADISEEMLQGYPKLEIIPMQVEVGGEHFLFGPGGNLTVKQFYEMQRAGKFASTSQINPQSYYDHFEPVLKAGQDIFYLCFTSGLSGTYNTANMTIADLKEKYPERKIICVDTLCAFVGEGFIVREALRMQKEGMSMEELQKWTEEHRLQVCHWFTVDMLDHLRHGGRISAASAAIGTVLNIKPLLHVAEDGTLKVMDKPRGRKKAFKLQMSKMEQGWMPELGKLVVIGHGDSIETALELKETVLSKYPDAEVHIADIGPVIGAHTGPGMLALIFWGTTR